MPTEIKKIYLTWLRASTATFPCAQASVGGPSELVRQLPAAIEDQEEERELGSLDSRAATRAAMARSDGRDYFQRTSMFWIVSVTFGISLYTVSPFNHFMLAATFRFGFLTFI